MEITGDQRWLDRQLPTIIRAIQKLDNLEQILQSIFIAQTLERS
jgi:hypothetical protein